MDARSPARRTWRAVGWTAAALAVALALAHGCITPPALLPAGPLETELARFPAGTERVELALESGETLRGVYAPADPGAPVVLHLPESSGSVFSRTFPYGRLAWDCADVGFALLFLDYRGVGASGGERSVDHIEQDALAMWNEAVRRAGGDPSLVVVRGVSIGALAAATLAESGARPGAWLLVAPVRGETVVARFVREQYNALLAFVVAPFFRPVTDVDLSHAIEAMRAPVHVIAPRDDFLVSPAEHAALQRAVSSVGGDWQWSASGHEFTSLAAHSLGNDENLFLRGLFPRWPDGEARAAEIVARLESSIAARFPYDSEERRRLAHVARRTRGADDRLAAAAALAGGDPDSAAWMLRMLRGAELGGLDSLDLDEIVRFFDLRDPSGALPVELVVSWWTWLGDVRRGGDLVGCPKTVAHLVALARASECEAERGVERLHRISRGGGWSSTRWPCIELWRTLNGGRELPRVSARRMAVRILLKALAIPDRVVVEDGAAPRLEALEDGEWRTVDLDWPEPCEGRDLGGEGEIDLADLVR